MKKMGSTLIWHCFLHAYLSKMVKMSINQVRGEHFLQFCFYNQQIGFQWANDCSARDPRLEHHHGQLFYCNSLGYVLYPYYSA